MTTVTDSMRLASQGVPWTLVIRLGHLARLAGQAILTCARGGFAIKPDGSPVTSADEAAQAIICDRLTEWDPALPIVAEEAALPDGAARAAWQRYWLVDPLDGTKEYLAGRTDYTVNIALIDAGEPVIGVVHAPALDIVYWAARGFGTWRQEGQSPRVRLRVRPPHPTAGVRLIESRSHPSPQLEQFVRQVRVDARIQLGSSLKFCWLAEGRADCYPRFGPTMAWDVAAGDCVFRNAAPGLTPHPSPLTYDPADFRQGPFVIGFAPPPDGRGDEPLPGECNHEPPRRELGEGQLTPARSFFVRCHFGVPDISPSSFRLRIGGLVDRSLSLTLDDLERMPARTDVATLECAGNGRGLLVPPAPGEPWKYGAVGTAAWTGVPLLELLAHSGVRERAEHIVLRGADAGRVAGDVERVRFERSLTRAQAEAADPLLAYAMNGAPLTREHGAPLRLVVPGWYGMAWLKWLTEIELIGDAFAGFFQTDRYCYVAERDGRVVNEPVTQQRVRALILSADADQSSAHALVIRGLAWSGVAPVARVEVAIDEGPWQTARLLGASAAGRWQSWEIVPELGDGEDRDRTVLVRARATDRSGQMQPAQPEWNRLGYGNNAVQGIRVRLP